MAIARESRSLLISGFRVRVPERPPWNQTLSSIDLQQHPVSAGPQRDKSPTGSCSPTLTLSTRTARPPAPAPVTRLRRGGQAPPRSCAARCSRADSRAQGGAGARPGLPKHFQFTHHRETRGDRLDQARPAPASNLKNSPPSALLEASTPPFSRMNSTGSAVRGPLPSRYAPSLRDSATICMFAGRRTAS